MSTLPDQIYRETIEKLNKEMEENADRKILEIAKKPDEESTREELLLKIAIIKLTATPRICPHCGGDTADLFPFTKKQVTPSPENISAKANHDWLKSNEVEYRGRWVALDAGKLVAVADSMKECIDESRNHENRVFIAKV